MDKTEKSFKVRKMKNLKIMQETGEWQFFRFFCAQTILFFIFIFFMVLKQFVETNGKHFLVIQFKTSILLMGVNEKHSLPSLIVCKF